MSNKRQVRAFLVGLWKPAALLAILSAVLLPSDPMAHRAQNVLCLAAFAASVLMFVVAGVAWVAAG